MRIVIKAVYPDNIPLAEVLLGGIRGVGFKLLKNVAKLGDMVYKNCSVKLLKRAEGKILKLLQDLTDKNQMPVNIDKLVFEKGAGSCIVAEAIAEIVDYKALINRFLPRIIEKAAKSDTVAGEIAELLKDEQEAIVSAVLDEVDDTKKNAIVSLLVKRYQKEICSYLTELSLIIGMKHLIVEEVFVE